MDESDHRRDGLTGLFDRSAMEEQAAGFAARAEGEVWSVIIIDVDDFKLINDVHGHLQGDKVLRRVGDIVSRNTRGTDVVIRYGGDEFLVVMPRTGNLQAVNQAQRILEDLAMEKFPREMTVSLSLGVADSRQGETDLSRLVDRADTALYQAKDAGRNQVSFYRDEHDWTSQATITFDHFVDRHRELRSLRDALDETLAGGGRLALISGEPGIGKSRLVEELRHYCRFRGCHFLEAKCDEVGAPRPCEQLLLPLQQCLAVLPADRRESVLMETGAVSPETAGLLPGVELRVLDLPDVPDPDQEGVARHRIFSEASMLVRKVADDQPVVFWVDGLQWMSENDLEMFCYLVRTAGPSRILFVATVRTPMEDHPGVRTRMNVLSRLVPFLGVELGELPDNYAGHMIMFALRDPRIPREILDRLVRKSGGNPFFLRELLRSLREKGSIEPSARGGWKYSFGEDVELPESVAQLISSRLDMLDDRSRETLRTAALSPGTFTIDLLSRVTGLQELDVARALREPLRMEVVTERLDEDFSPVYSFNHDIVRSFLCGEMTHGIRKALNSKFGRYFEELYRAGDGSLLTTVARYYSDSLDRKSAVVYSLEAARESLRSQSNTEALRWLETYVALSGSESRDRDEEFFVWSELGRLYTVAARHGEARKAMGRARKYADTDEQRGLVSAELGQLYYNMGEYGEATEELERAVSLLPLCERSIRASMRLAFMSHLRGDSIRSARMFDDAHKLIEQIPDPQVRMRLEAGYCSGAGFIKVHSRSVSEGMELSRKAVELHRELGDREGEARSILNLAAVLSSGGNWEERTRILDRAMEVLTETGDTHSIMVAMVNLGQVYFGVGQLEQSREYFEKCLDLAEATGTRRFEVWCSCHIAMILEREERFDHAEEWFRRAIARADELGLARMLLVSRLNLLLMLLKRGEFEAAGELLEVLGSDEALPRMTGSIGNAYVTAKGLRLYLDRSPGRDRKEDLKAAEEMFRRALAGVSDGDFGDLAENSLYLAGCLEESGRPEESLAVASGALDRINDILRTVRSSVFRDDMRRMAAVSGLTELKQRLADGGHSGS
jgi:diguanylate cyclase (GGDEF)-like protein